MINRVEELHGRDKPFAASTDITGVFGKIDDVLEFYKKVGLCLDSLGLEVMGWHGAVRTQEALLQHLQNMIIGFHGRMGFIPSDDWKDNLKVRLINPFISSPEEILEFIRYYLSPQAMYLLHHQPAAEQFYNSSFFANLPDHIHPVIENHVQANALVEARTLQRQLNAAGNEVGFVFDLVHFLKEGDGKVDISKWTQMIELLNQVGQCIIHLPIGNNSNDSLPFDQISSEMWSQLAEVIKQNNCFVTIEFQHGNLWDDMFGQPHLNAKLINITRERFKVLFQHGIIPFAPQRKFH